MVDLQILTLLSFKNYNLADWLSFSRLAAFPFLIVLGLLDQRTGFSWLLLFTYSTDALDGYVARKWKMCSARGAQLDSLADQMNFVAALFGLYLFEGQFIREHLFWILVPFSLYFIQMSYAFVKYGRATAFHTLLAKLSAIAQAGFVLWFLFFGPLHWLFALMIVLGIVETLEEIWLIRVYDHWTEGVKGIFWAWKDPRRNQLNAEG